MPIGDRKKLIGLLSSEPRTVDDLWQSYQDEPEVIDIILAIQRDIPGLPLETAEALWFATDVERMGGLELLESPMTYITEDLR